MRNAIINFHKQFDYEPKIENPENFKSFNRFIIVGMGGSHLAGGLALTWNPSLDIVIHRDYGLPAVSDESLKNSLIIASSYSGNTEEVVSAFKEAQEKRLSIFVISVGGTLIDLAKKHSVPYIQMPDTGIQPRSALGFSFAALLKVMEEEEALKELGELTSSLDPQSYGERGKGLAEKLKGKVPIIYSSTRNHSIAYNWKIKFNETGKIPAFYNVLPELNHNEMTGFDVKDSTKELSGNFAFVFLKDTEDNPRIVKRMEVLEQLYRDRGLPVEIIELEGQSKFYKIFSSLLLADWIAYYTAEQYGLESEQVPMVEEFKKIIA